MPSIIDVHAYFFFFFLHINIFQIETKTKNKNSNRLIFVQLTQNYAEINPNNINKDVYLKHIKTLMNLVH